MYLQGILIVLLGSCWIGQSEETIGSWDLSSLLSTMIHGDHDIESETALERHLSRRKRSTGPTEYTVDIEISFPDASFLNQIKQFIATNLTLPISVDSSGTTITNISVTTECNQTGSNVQCSCESGFKWTTAVCNSYSTCSGSRDSPCDCIKGTSIPTQYCQLQPVSINLSLKLLEPFTSDFTNSASAKYKEYKGKLETQLNSSYYSLPGFISATVNGFRSGSIVADYTLVTEPVSSSTLTTANSNLLNNLRLANISVDSVIKTIITDQSHITVSPSSIFNKDSVTLTCTVNTTTTSVIWYFNNTATPSTSYSTKIVGSSVQSILNLRSVSQSDAGTYRCIVEDGSNSYQTDQTIIVQPLDITVLNTNIACNNTEISVVQCCTEGSSMDFDLTCSTAQKSGIARTNLLCKTYQVVIDQATCASLKTGNYFCSCFTKYGANDTRNIPVRYQAIYAATVTTGTPTISEGKDLTVQCTCNATSVQSINWYLQNTIIPSKYYTSTNLKDCTSTLTIPAADLRVSWSGTFQCSVDTGSVDNALGSIAINIAKLINQNQIIVNPVSQYFKSRQSIDFSCCIGDTRGYKGAVLQITTDKVNKPVMTTGSSCFTYTYTPTTDQSFTAECIITNQIDNTVTSGDMKLIFVENPKCTLQYYGELNSVITVLCETDDATLTGTKNLTCKDSGNGAAVWTLAGSDCRSAALTNIQNTLNTLTSPTSQTELPAVLGNLSSTVNTEKQSISQSANNIQLVVNILQQVQNVITTVEEPAMKDFLQTVNVIVDNSSTWNQVPHKEQASSNLLQSVEKFAEKLIITGPIFIRNNTNIQLTGNVISNLTSDYTADFDFSKTNNLTGNVFINRTTLYGLLPNATVISVAYATLKDILGNPSNNSSTEGVINGLVMTTTLTGNIAKFQIGMDFKKSNPILNKTACVFWNFNKTNWDSTGCQPQLNNDSTMVTCACNHLTSFSILMSSDAYFDKKTEEILTWISYIGLGISILSLVICIIIEATVWKSVTKNKTSYMRHVCIMNISVTLLLADIWFIIGNVVSADNAKLDACVTATFFTHVFYLCTFFWMLTMGLILFYRLMCVFHDLSKTVMMGISFFLGYGCPIIISVITVAVTQPSKKYTKDKTCWLNVKESGAFIAFVVPALTILLVNFVTLFVVIIKVLRPSVGDKPKKEEKSSLNHITKCILILTPLLGLTWGFGIGTLFSSDPAIHGIFSALNALQGLFILLFGCLLDKKVRDALLSRFSVSRWSSQQTKSSNLSSSDPVFSKGVINLFAKKGVYNISSAQAGPSSEMSNSYSLLT